MGVEISFTFFFATGVVTSPRFPRRYLNDIEKTQTIQGEEGKILVLDFNYFAIWHCSGCECDHIKVTDGDGTILLGKSCGFSSRQYMINSDEHFKPPKIITRSNVVHLYFKTDNEDTTTGWSVSWKAVTPGVH